MSFRAIRLGVFGAALAAFATSASATYHTYKFVEVYSNSSGTIQFIVLHETDNLNNQNHEHLAPDIFSFSGTFTNSGATRENTLTLTDLPSTNTANTFFLLGTAGYNALPGAPQADYLIPNNFFNPLGDSLQYGSTGIDGIVDQMAFGPLPTDPTEALIRDPSTGDTSVGPAIANTFSAGGNFLLPEPTAAAVLALFSAGLLSVRRRHG